MAAESKHVSHSANQKNVFRSVDKIEQQAICESKVYDKRHLAPRVKKQKFTIYNCACRLETRSTFESQTIESEIDFMSGEHTPSPTSVDKECDVAKETGNIL